MKKIMVLSALLCVFFSSCNTSGDSSDVYYTVSFNSNGGSFVTAQSIKSGETAKQPVSPIRENYIFNGWYKGSYKFYFSTPITESITLTAKWKAETAPGTEEGNTKTYTITYNTTYGTKPSTISLAENTASVRVLEKCGFTQVYKGLGNYQGKEAEIIKNIWRSKCYI